MPKGFTSITSPGSLVLNDLSEQQGSVIVTAAPLEIDRFPANSAAARRSDRRLTGSVTRAFSDHSIWSSGASNLGLRTTNAKTKTPSVHWPQPQRPDPPAVLRDALGGARPTGGGRHQADALTFETITILRHSGIATAERNQRRSIGKILVGP